MLKIGDLVTIRIYETGREAHNNYSSTWVIEEKGIIIDVSDTAVERLRYLVELKDRSRQWVYPENIELIK